MTIQDTTVAKVRMGSLGLVGLSCLSYAVLAVTQNTPQPFWWFVPGLAGVVAMLAIFIAFALADPAARRMAHDEMHSQTEHRAQRHAYWVALWLYPVFGVVSYFELLSSATIFAAMGTLTGAAYLLLVTYYEWRMS